MYGESSPYQIPEELANKKRRLEKIWDSLYCIDTGLRNAVSFKFSDDIRRLVENAVFVELKRHKQEAYY